MPAIPVFIPFVLAAVLSADGPWELDLSYSGSSAANVARFSCGGPPDKLPLYAELQITPEKGVLTNEVKLFHQAASFSSPNQYFRLNNSTNTIEITEDPNEASIFLIKREEDEFHAGGRFHLEYISSSGENLSIWAKLEDFARRMSICEPYNLIAAVQNSTGSSSEEEELPKVTFPLLGVITPYYAL